MQPYTTGGVCINDIGRESEDGADQVRAAYGASYPQRVALKDKYGPPNLFRLNQNIQPTLTATQ